MNADRGHGCFPTAFQLGWLKFFCYLQDWSSIGGFAGENDSFQTNSRGRWGQKGLRFKRPQESPKGVRSDQPFTTKAEAVPVDANLAIPLILCAVLFFLPAMIIRF